MRIFDKVKYLLPIKLPKEVVIFNGRLSCLFIIIQLIVVIGFFYLFILAGKEHYTIQTPILLPPIFWRNSMNTYGAAVAADEASMACTNNKNYRFYSGSDFVYADYKCVELPMQEMFMKTGYTVGFFPTFFEEQRTLSKYINTEINGCAKHFPCELYSPSSLTGNMTLDQVKFDQYNALKTIGTEPWWKYDRANSPYEKKESPYGSGMTECQCRKTANYIVKGVAEQEFVIDHSYEDPKPDTLGTIYATERGRSSYTLKDVKEKLGDNGRTILSIIEKYNDKEGKYEEFDCGLDRGLFAPGKCRFKPKISGESVKLSLAQWAKAGGVDLADADYLNTAISDANGFRVGKSSEGLSPDDLVHAAPLLRLSGVEITLKIAYYEDEFVDDYEVDDASKSIIAKIQVKVSVGSWASQPAVSYGQIPYASDMTDGAESQVRGRYYYGVRFVILQGTMGKFGHFVLQGVIAFLAVVSVYLGLVTKVMKVIATTLLGDTSRSYKRAQLDSFNIDRDAQQVAPGMILAAAGSFRTLCDAAGQHCIIERDDVTGLQKRYLTQTAVQAILTRVFNENLDPKGIAIMASNVYTSISTDENFGNEAAVGSGEAAAASKRMDTRVPGIDLNSFVRAVCRNMVIDFEALANLYDLSDSKGCIEQFFGEQVHLNKNAEALAHHGSAADL